MFGYDKDELLFFGDLFICKNGSNMNVMEHRAQCLQFSNSLRTVEYVWSNTKTKNIKNFEFICA